MTLDELSELIVRPNHHLDAGIRVRDYRRAAAGELHRLVPGRFVESSAWSTLHQDARHRLRVLAAAERLPVDEVISHWSAAALWRLPVIGSWPDRVHVTAAPDRKRQSTTAVVRHRRELVDEPQHLAGLPVTSLAETVIDIARIASFSQAVAMGDAALWREQHPRDAGGRPGVTTAELERVWSESHEYRGLARARRVLGFIDGRANRPGESLARVTMAALGVPAPELQHPIVLPNGKRYELDFYFPEFDVGLEFDGRAKYLDPAFRGGRTAEQVVYDEKVREDHVRSALRGFGRCDWTVAGSPALLGGLLRRIGVRW
jgi:hypothetical protein